VCYNLFIFVGIFCIDELDAKSVWNAAAAAATTSTTTAAAAVQRKPTNGNDEQWNEYWNDEQYEFLKNGGSGSGRF